MLVRPDWRRQGPKSLSTGFGKVGFGDVHQPQGLIGLLVVVADRISSAPGVIGQGKKIVGCRKGNQELLPLGIDRDGLAGAVDRRGGWGLRDIMPLNNRGVWNDSKGLGGG